MAVASVVLDEIRDGKPTPKGTPITLPEVRKVLRELKLGKPAKMVSEAVLMIFALEALKAVRGGEEEELGDGGDGPSELAVPAPLPPGRLGRKRLLPFKLRSAERGVDNSLGGSRAAMHGGLSGLTHGLQTYGVNPENNAGRCCQTAT